MRLRYITGLTGAVLVLASCVDVFAQTNARATGNWSDPLTWDGGEPTGTSDARVNGGFTVTIDQGGETSQLLNVGSIASQTGNVNMSGGNLFINATTPATPTSTSGIIVGASGGTGTFTKTAGDIFVGGTLGSDIFTPAGGAGPVRPEGELIVGLEGGTGTVTQSGGSFQMADETFIGFREGSTGTVNVSAGTFETVGRSILLGFQGGSGSLNVTGTGDVNAGFDILTSFGGASSSNITLADDGTIDCGFLFTNFVGDPGSMTTINMTGGTLTSRLAVVLGQGGGTTTMTHSGGTVNVMTNNGDFVVSDSFDPGRANTSTYNISGMAATNLLHNMILGAFGESNGTVNQSGSSTVTAGDNVFVGRDNLGTYNISGGTLTATNFDIVLGNFSDASNGTVNQTGGTVKAGVNLVVARDGTGNYNLSAGTVEAQNIFLGDFDTSVGTMKITGGTVTLTGNMSVGGALASNAAPDRVEPNGSNGAQGQALTAQGKLIVSGNAATINVGGNFLANPSDKSSFRSHPFAPGGNNIADLVFEIFNSSGTSLINTTGVADLDGAVIDIDLMSGFTPANNATFDLLKASSFGPTGSGTTQNVGTGMGYSLATEDAGIFSLAVVPSGGGQVLRATFLGVAPGVQGDYNDNGVVDAADYVLWRNGGPLQNDPTAGVQPGDYDFWRSRFGNTSGSGSSTASAVPEPATWMLIVAAAAFAFGQSKRNG